MQMELQRWETTFVRQSSQTSHVGHQTPLVFLEALALRALSAHEAGNQSIHESNVGGRAAAGKCRKCCQGKGSCVHPLAQGTTKGHRQSLGFLLAPSLPESKLTLVSNFPYK